MTSDQIHPTWKPELLNPSEGDGLRRIAELKQSKTVDFIDLLAAQYAELTKCTGAESPVKNGILDDTLGIWAYYPWLNKAIRILTRNDFIRLRTDRNRNKITAEEQELLSGKKVGIVGLSVGRSVALTLAQERVAGEIRLADFDSIELSNLNRIRTGLDTLGLNKAIAAAREIALIDPYIKVSVFQDGLSKDNVESFLLDNGKLDALIEECDTVQVKISSRIKAKEHGIPVIMDTSDRGMVDVERFDLNPQLDILHGKLKHLDIANIDREMTNEEKMPYLAPMVGINDVSSRLKASAIEIGHSLSTWPQLASSIALGGAIVTDVCRRIFLDEFRASGRWYVDLNEIISSHEPIEETADADNELVLPAAADELEDLAENPLLDSEQIMAILDAARYAPSAGNLQPWLFHVTGQTIHLLRDTRFESGLLDANGMIGTISLGACIENMIRSAEEFGVNLATRISESQNDGYVASLFPEQSCTPVKGLIQSLKSRVTNRKLSKRSALSQAQQKSLKQVELPAGVRLKFFGDDISLNTLANCVGRAERLRMLNELGHKDLFGHELFWPENKDSCSRGLDVRTLELDKQSLVGLKLARDPKAVSLIAQWNKGQAFTAARLAVMASQGLVLIAVKGSSHDAWIRGGMAAQRFWVHANGLGYAVQPVSAPVFLTRHNQLTQGQGLSKAEQAELEDIRKTMARIVDLGPNEFPLFLMKLTPGSTPSMRSSRVELNKLITKNSWFTHVEQHRTDNDTVL